MVETAHGPGEQEEPSLCAYVTMVVSTCTLEGQPGGELLCVSSACKHYIEHHTCASAVNTRRLCAPPPPQTHAARRLAAIQPTALSSSLPVLDEVHVTHSKAVHVRLQQGAYRAFGGAVAFSGASTLQQLRVDGGNYSLNTATCTGSSFCQQVGRPET